MKKSGILAVSLAAASATAVSVPATSSASFTLNTRPPLNQEDGSSKGRKESTDKFAPKFDGLKFIETLVTAHR
ncbi:uncharacterized protein LOC141602728 [Silene latifolia]|uniref:uncharacterized protein LOC141602728 n=1 Tax=Silene latifolia TaxID=37657 RepID=UPI003D78446D